MATGKYQKKELTDCIGDIISRAEFIAAGDMAAHNESFSDAARETEWGRCPVLRGNPLTTKFIALADTISKFEDVRKDADKIVKLLSIAGEMEKVFIADLLSRGAG